jgi:hypothetical protein
MVDVQPMRGPNWQFVFKPFTGNALDCENAVSERLNPR